MSPTSLLTSTTSQLLQPIPYRRAACLHLWALGVWQLHAAQTRQQPSCLSAVSAPNGDPPCKPPNLRHRSRICPNESFPSLQKYTRGTSDGGRCLCFFLSMPFRPVRYSISLPFCTPQILPCSPHRSSICSEKRESRGPGVGKVPAGKFPRGQSPDEVICEIDLRALRPITARPTLLPVDSTIESGRYIAVIRRNQSNIFLIKLCLPGQKTLTAAGSKGGSFIRAEGVIDNRPSSEAVCPKIRNVGPLKKSPISGNALLGEIFPS